MALARERLTNKAFCVLTAKLNFCQSDLEGIGVAVDAQNEGVLIGVMLDDVVVHVHQDSVTQQRTQSEM